MKEDKNEWTSVIEPHERLLKVNLREVWNYRDLCSLFIKRNITTQFKQTIFGPLWYIIQPVMTVVIYMVVFGGIAKISTDGLPQPLFYLSGICLWQYFSDCLTKTSSTFIDNASIFGKVYFPRLVIPLANVISNLLRFCVQFGLFLIVYAIYQIWIIPGEIHTNWYILLLPLLVAMLAGLALGFGILFSSLTTTSGLNRLTMLSSDTDLGCLRMSTWITSLNIVARNDATGLPKESLNSKTL